MSNGNPNDPLDLINQVTNVKQGNQVYLPGVDAPNEDFPKSTGSSQSQSFEPWFPEFFDSSMLADFKSCPEKFRKSYIQHWRSKLGSVHLVAGGAFAKGLEVARRSFYEAGDDADTAIALGLQALVKEYGQFQCPPESAKSLERTAGAFEYFFTQYPLDHEDFVPIILPGGGRGIEFNFAHPLPIDHPVTGNPLLYVGRMDAIVSHAGGNYINDEKTTSQLGSTWPKQWDLRAQFTGYAWGCRETGIRVEGAIIRGISILKTKYDTAKTIVSESEWQIDRWYDELLEWIQDIIINWDRRGPNQPWRHNLDHSCSEYGGCQFRESCLARDEQPWLETFFERREWNPLTRVERRL